MKSNEISVVVQGAIDKEYTKKCLNSIRKHLPKAEIILSTWKGSNVEGLSYDILVQNDDPGATVCDKTVNANNNTNRQLLSTQNGLKKATRKYTLKFRTDFYLKGKGFIGYFEKFPKRDDKYNIFKHRVLANAAYSKERMSYRESSKLPFHPSDFWFFGLSEDIKLFFEDTPLVSFEDLANYKVLYEDKKPLEKFSFRYAPEQHLCFSFVKRHFPDVQFDDWTDWNDENCEFSKNILYNNFVFLDYYESDVFSDKHYEPLNYQHEEKESMIYYEKFIQEYKERYDSKFNTKESLKIKLKKYLGKLELYYRQVAKKYLIRLYLVFFNRY